MGRTVEEPMDSSRLADEDLEFAYAVDSAAEKVTMVIKDANGEVVRTIPGETGAGRHEIVWDGLRDDGSVAAHGNYRIEITATGKGDKTVAAPQIGRAHV